MKLLMSLFFLLLCALASGAGATDRVKFELPLGQTHILRLEDNAEVVITAPEVMGYQQLPSGVLVLTGKSAGQTEVLIFHQAQLYKSYRFNVTALVDERMQLELTALQRLYPQLKIEAYGTGLTRLSGQLPAVAQRDIDALLQRFPQLVSQIEWLAEPEAPMLVLEVRIAEVKRSFARHLGVRWPGHVNGPRIEDLGSWIHLPLTAQTTLDLMEREGQARLLATPTLTAVSGSKANFLVGGEFPVPQVLAQGLQDVSFRPYGIQLEIAPVLLANGRVSAQLLAELSSIDPATAVNGVPGLLSRKVMSTLTIPLGETLVLSGLIHHEQAQHADRFPALHSLPVLGALFSSEQFRSAETDLLIMVTPRLAELESSKRMNAARGSEQRREFFARSGCVGLIEPFTFPTMQPERR
ncbi:type II and III secretion system protein family protein [Pseudidiomarina insulisalsae]|uniref:Uncharacterized protein n=1 Tax=Pseudidiomarina insulisalsae TaxID=575789 RepID=A0A432Y8S6_9GAMM|nr:pilus assembly protein N-terminal domain-containing protein [Pseudidiomarina insulisalsae]RUO57337.1 hypothetical protein CWI71_11830 [Pseudidiomarina insulisalsae]